MGRSEAPVSAAGQVASERQNHAVAVPLYINYVKDARRTEAKGAIAAVISAEQIFYQTNGAYTKDPLQLRLDKIVEEVKKNWTVNVDSADPTAKFMVSAQGVGDAQDLYVCCTYYRNLPPHWGEAVGDCAP